jgi:hypothetical protein
LNAGTLISVSLLIVFALASAVAQQPSPSPNDEKSEALPAASGSPEPQGAPDLLPESTSLPAAPPDLHLPSPINLLSPETGSRGSPAPKTPLSPAEQARIRVRLSELREAAEHTPRAVYLLKLAGGALSDEAKREFMRAYQHTVCTEMRRLDPRLVEAINDYERTQIRHLAQGPSHLVVTSRRSRGERQHRLKSTDR